MKVIFEAALDKGTEERRQFLESACLGDEDLRLELARLLSYHEKAASFFDHSPPGPGSATIPCKSNKRLFFNGQMLCDRFVILEFLGSGGMGQVYAAKDLELEEDVAVKVLHSSVTEDQGTVARFVREVQLARRITHPNICRIFDIGKHRDDDGREFPIITMQLLRGETLAQYLQTTGSMSLREAVPIVEQMCQGLEAAHHQGIVHRDFKPANIMVSRRPEGVRLVITDFGLACLASGTNNLSSLTVTGGIVGTLDYMAPEQIDPGETSVQSDIYALGVVIYELVTGQRPFPGPSPMARLAMRLSRKPIPPCEVNATLPIEWQRTILRCLEEKPSDRFGSTAEILESLKSSSRSRRLELPHVRRASKKGLVILCVLALCLALSLYTLRLLHESGTLAAGSSVLITDFAVQDAELQGATTALKSQLAQSAHFQIVNDERVNEVLKEMRVNRSQLDQPAVSRELGLRTGAAMVVYGSISQLGGEYVLDVKLERTGASPALVKRTWKHEFSSLSRRELFDAIHQAASWIRTTVGESAGEMARQDRPPEDTTTSSWPALQLLVQANEKVGAGDDQAAVVLLREAIEADPDFAAAHMRLADLLVSMNDYREGYSHWQKAVELTDKHELTSRENLRIRGQYLEDTGDLQGAEQVYRAFALHYPYDSTPLLYLGSVLDDLDSSDEAITVFQKASQLRPQSFVANEQLATIYLSQRRWQAAKQETEKVARFGGTEWAILLDGISEFLQADYEQALNTMSRLSDSPKDEWKSRGFSEQASLSAELGRYQAAISLLRRGIEFDSAHGLRTSEADKNIQIAYVLFRNGKSEEARSAIDDALKLQNSPTQILPAGILLARLGSIAGARKLLRTLDHEWDVPTIRVARHRLRGEIALAERNTALAVAEFQKASQSDRPKADRTYLAQADEDAGDHRSAGALWKKIYDDPTILWLYHPPDFPGLWADSLLLYSKMEAQVNMSEACPLIHRYVAMRGHAESRQMQAEIAGLPVSACRP